MTFRAMGGVVLAVAVTGCCRASSAESEQRPAPKPVVTAALVASSPAPAAPAKHEDACTASPWLTYGHDAKRTSASEGCVDGALSIAWRFLPETPGARESQAVHVIADERTVYASGRRGDSPTLYRLGTNGDLVWSFDTRADIDRGHWPTVAFGSILLDDDGLWLLRADDGQQMTERRLDTWGQSLSDGVRWIVTNTWHVEGPGTFVGALDSSGNVLWKQNKYGSVKEDVMDEVGAIVLSSGVVFHAANYRFMPHSGLFAFDASTGERRWWGATIPVSDLAADDARVYLVEKEARGKDPFLVAHAQKSGDAVWRVPAKPATAAAPVVAGGLVFLELDDGIAAFDATTGAARWKTRTSRKRSTKTPMGATFLAAAKGSRTLVYTANGEIHVFAMDDGRETTSIPVVEGDVHGPVLVGRRLYVVADGAILALDPAPRG